MTEPMQPATLLDFSSILHSHASDLSNISQWLASIKDYLGADPFWGFEDVTHVEVATVIDPTAQKLLSAIEVVRSRAAGDFEALGCSAHFAQLLNEMHEFLLTYLKVDASGRPRPPYMQSRLLEFKEALPSRKSIKVANSVIRDLGIAIAEIQRVLCYYDLRTSLERISDMEHQTKGLSEFLASGNKELEQMQPVPITQLMNLAVRDRGGFAYRRNIQIEIVDNAKGKVMVRKGDVLRALGHLLNNAIKYNYLLKNGRVWVKVRTFRNGQTICISFENWGVPVTADEIEVIFRAGRRGAYASAKGAQGHGIGLADAKRVIDSHEGTISITSVPAQPQPGNKLDYSKPFLTTVAVALPEYR